MIPNCYRISLLAILLLLSVPAWAQRRLQGVVLDAQRQPVIGANVYIAQTYDGATTDVQGRFSFQSRQPFPFLLQVSFIGYKPFSLLVGSEAQLQDLQLQLREDASVLETVVVTAGSFLASDERKAAQLSSNDMLSTASAVGDVPGAINTLPGTTVNGESGRLFVRGGDDSEVATYVNGALVPRAYGSSVPNMSVRGRYSPFLFRGAFFSSGGYGAEYGQALSSVLALQTAPMPETPETQLSAMAAGLEVAHSRKVRDTEVHAELTYYNLKPLFRVLSLNQEWEKEPSSLNALLHLRQPIGKHSVGLFSSWQQGSLALYQPAATGAPALQSIKNANRYLSLNAQGPIAGSWTYRSAFSASYNRDRLVLPSLQSEEGEMALFGKWLAEGEVGDHLLLKLGTEVQHFDWERDLPALQQQASLPLAAVFAESTWALSSRLGVVAGYRHEMARGKHFPMPRLSVGYKVGQEGNLSAAVGRYVQRHTPQDYLRQSDLAFAVANHYLLSYQWQRKGRLLRGEVYRKDYDRLVCYLPQGGADERGYGMAQGAEIWWRDSKSIPSADYWISYSFMDASRLYKDYPVQARPGFVARHNVSVVYKHFVPFLRSQLGGSWQYNSGRPYSLPGETFQARTTKAYATLDLNWAYLPRPNLIVYCSVSNVLGRRNVFGYQSAATPEGLALQPIRPAYDRFYFIGVFWTLSRNGQKNQLDKL